MNNAGMVRTKGVPSTMMAIRPSRILEAMTSGFSELATVAKMESQNNGTGAKVMQREQKLISEAQVLY